VAGLVSRFRSEIKLAWRIRHRNVCGIHEYGEDGDLLYISMELVDGRDLRRLVREKGALLWEEAYDVAVQAAEGLEAIHDAGVIHRDLKPSNIMLDSKGVVRVMDFGIAKVWGTGSGSGVTGTGHVVGSPEYMSPEQVRDQDLDFRSDLYSLGAVIFEVFTGRAPFKAETPMATMLRHLEQAPPLDGPEAVRIPAPLLPILRRALAKAPGDRFKDCAAMRTALEAARLAVASQLTEDVPHSIGVAQPRSSAARLLVPQLLRALHHADPAVRHDAAEALGAMETERSVVLPPLRDARQRDDDPRVRAAAEAALARLGPEPVAPEPPPAPPPAPPPPPARPASPPPPAPALPPKLTEPPPATPPLAPRAPRMLRIEKTPPRRPVGRSRFGVVAVAVGLALLLVLAAWLVYVGVQGRPTATATPGPSATALPPTPSEPPPTSAPSPVVTPSPTVTTAPKAAGPNSTPSTRPGPLAPTPRASRTSLASVEPAGVSHVLSANPAPAPTTTLAPLPTPEPVDRSEVAPTPTPLPSPPTPPALQPRPGDLVRLTDPSVRPPKATTPLAAMHTLMTERLGLTGTVDLSILVDEKGSVAEARVLRVESRPRGAEFEAVLRDAALKSAQKWRFEPAQQAGVAVRVWLPVRIDF
jgi:serine/threonine-protein kinase